MEYVEDDIWLALSRGDILDVEKCLASGLGVNHIFTCCSDAKSHGMTLLHVAVSEQQFDMVRFLLRKGVDVNKAASVINYSKKDRKSQVKVLKGNNRLHMTCLFHAICSGDAEMTKLLVANGADVNLYDNSYCTALWHAVDTNNDQITHHILQTSSRNINLSDQLKITPLHVAAVHRNPGTLGKLLKGGAIVDVRQIQGASPLFTACASGCLETTHLLLKHGANPNMKDKDGLTPLLTALDRSKNPDLVILLIEAGAYVYSSDIYRFHRQYSILSEHPELKEYVDDAIDKPNSLKLLSAHVIKACLRSRKAGKSIYNAFIILPLPTPIVKYLRLDTY